MPRHRQTLGYQKAFGRGPNVCPLVTAKHQHLPGVQVMMSHSQQSYEPNLKGGEYFSPLKTPVGLINACVLWYWGKCYIVWLKYNKLRGNIQEIITHLLVPAVVQWQTPDNVPAPVLIHPSYRSMCKLFSPYQRHMNASADRWFS